MTTYGNTQILCTLLQASDLFQTIVMITIKRKKDAI